jgi:hypothetical protein
VRQAGVFHSESGAVSVVALAFFVTGLVLGVYAMLHGTERSVAPMGAPHERRSEYNPAAEPSAVFNLASIAAFGVAFGLTGYLVDRYTDASWMLALVTALLAGGAGLALQSLLIARWAIPSARADDMDPRYLLQGTLAKVTQAPADSRTGALVYVLDGHECTLPVRSLDGAAFALGAEVVIDRVEDGVAFAESWAAVEQRL